MQFVQLSNIQKFQLNMLYYYCWTSYLLLLTIQCGDSGLCITDMMLTNFLVITNKLFHLRC